MEGESGAAVALAAASVGAEDRASRAFSLFLFSGVSDAAAEGAAIETDETINSSVIDNLTVER
jgi:hypothetical protein